jgi:hypothetical protein
MLPPAEYSADNEPRLMMLLMASATDISGWLSWLSGTYTRKPLVGFAMEMIAGRRQNDCQTGKRIVPERWMGFDGHARENSRTPIELT